MKCFNGFCKAGVVHADTVNDILEMMGLRVKKEALDAIIAEVDEDGKKFDKGQLIKAIFEVFHLNQKKERKYFCISALASKMGQIKEVKVQIRTRKFAFEID